MQVQVHGYRVELGWVEAALRGLPGIFDAVVLAVPTPDGSVELASAHTGPAGPAHDTAGSAAEDLRDALRRRLPPYMVPARLTSVDANGEADRTAVRRLLGGTATD
ncbi:hypothetical protein ACFVY4_02670 [Streptomyces sp. NPDC058299]|uniref:AMP-binding enzyme n=1 Tax=Streptomyces sp. NPDC058299 TaxID=3346435 RepID=UPI0036E79D28